MTTKYRHILAAVLLVLALGAPFVYCLGLVMEWNWCDELPFKYWCIFTVVGSLIAHSLYKGRFIW